MIKKRILTICICICMMAFTAYPVRAEEATEQNIEFESRAVTEEVEAGDDWFPILCLFLLAAGTFAGYKLNDNKKNG